ncbi:MAG: aminodeoxychorismate synthase component I [Bacteroidales bacterium]
MKTALELQKLMNRAGTYKTPFLFVVDYELSNGIFIENPLENKEVLWRVGSVTNAPNSHLHPHTPALAETKHGTFLKARPIDYNKYACKFNLLKEQLMLGNSFLANLTIRTPIETDYTLEEIFHKSTSPYALLIPNKLVCFSPEIFVKISKDGTISSNPMKGTISATVENAEQVILSDYKESAEHYTIVDFIRSDLSRVSTNVNVNKLRYIDCLHTSKGDILQVSSLISGKLIKKNLGDIIFELLPPGSVSGAPKPSTLNILKKIEGEPRGFYCGVFGYYNGTSLDSAVMIRYIEKEDDKFYFRSGGGITINSSCKDEYNEVIQKIYFPFL